MGIIITGASGFVGRLIIPDLIDEDIDLLLVGRNKKKLSLLFPNCNVCQKEEIKYNNKKKYTTMIHLAVLNNNVKADYKTFEDVNINLTIQYVEIAKEIGISNFINVSSIHTLSDKNDSNYSRTKKKVIDKLKQIRGINISNIYLPYIYGGRWNGKLALLNKFPQSISSFIFKIMSSLLPTVHYMKIVNHFISNNFKDDLIIFDNQNENFFYKFLKRSGDLLFASMILFFFWWAIIIIWMLIKIDSPGSGFFKQERIGRLKKKIYCFKFRTMKIDTINAASHEVNPNSITKIGIFLRKTKLDELPQILNIFKNEMSLIGPRPCLIIQEELIKKREDNNIFDLKPGISGLSQVNGIDMSNIELLTHWDSKYNALRCIILDVKIILSTILGKGQGDKVKKNL